MAFWGALRRVWARLALAPLPAAATAVSIGVAVFLFGALLLTGENVGRALRGWAGEGAPITVYARTDRPEPLRDRIAAAPRVAAVRWVSPKDGLKELGEALGEGSSILDGVDAEAVLPHAFLVRVDPAAASEEGVAALTRELRAIEGVEDVESERAWLDQYERVARAGRLLLVGWAVLLGMGLLVIVGNSARLAAFTRRDEIEILRLVGASDAFILLPFTIEGFVVGALGGFLGIAALSVLWWAMGDVLAAGPLAWTAPRFLEPAALPVMVSCGAVLGMAGSTFSAWRFLRRVPL